jgi:hypothetical protein
LGYRIIPDAETPEEEVSTLNQWILDKADDPMYRFGQSTGYDPSAQTERFRMILFRLQHTE